MPFFVAGTGTDIGKTVVCAWLCYHLGCDYWKPIQSGYAESSDTETVATLSGARTHSEAYLLSAPLSPHEAAHREGIHIDVNSIECPAVQSLCIEGAGGLMVPLNTDILQIDWIQERGWPVLLVASSTLGTINHTLLSLEALRRRGIPVVGVILNGPSHPNNAEAITHYSGVPVLAQLPKMSALMDELRATPVPIECAEIIRRCL